MPIILKLYILTACPEQTIYRLFAKVICDRKELLYFFQLPLPLPELEFATVNVRPIKYFYPILGNVFIENPSLRKQNLSLWAFLVGCFMLIFHKM